LARLRQVESQAKGRSTIQRHVSTWKPLGRILSPSRTVSLGAHTPHWLLQGVFHHLHPPPEDLCGPFEEATFLRRAVGPYQREPRNAATQWLQKVCATLLILTTSFLHSHAQDHLQGLDEDVPRAPVDVLSAVISASPPF
jgi:hypothetical protein